MRPEEFERLQPQEFYKLLDGWKWRAEQDNAKRERAESVAAYFVAHLLNVSGKTLRGHVKVSDLTEPLLKPAGKSRSSDEEYLREVFRDRLGGEQHRDGS